MSNSLTGYYPPAWNAIARADLRILAAFAATYIFWGGTFLAVAVALPSIPPFLLMGSRSLAGGVILFAYAKYRGARTPAPLWLIAGGCGLLLFVGCHGVMAFAQQRVPSGVTAIILATIPFWIAIIGFVIPSKKPPRLLTLALLIPGLAGVALIAWEQVTSGVAGSRLVDIALLLGASFSWALGSLLLERNTSRENCAITMSGMALIVGGIALVSISVAAGEFQHFQLQGLSMASAVGWLYLLIAGTILAFGSYVWLLERVSPTLVATYTFVNPIIAVLLGWAILGEPFSLSALAGGALVVISIIGLLFFDPAPAKTETSRGDDA